MTMGLPIISLHALSDGDQNPEIRRLYEACYERGFFYIKDHGVSPVSVRRAIEASRRFFSLPEDVKRLYGHDRQEVRPKASRGYVPEYGEILDKETGPDRKEIFDMGLERPLSGEPFTGRTIMPDDDVAPDFAAAHLQLQGEIMSKVVPALLRALALALRREATFFDQYFSDPVLIQRVIRYRRSQSGAGKHTDNGIFTVLIQERHDSPSLRVYTKNAWLDVPCLDDVFVINLGDMLQLWTKGLFVSTPHEVNHRQPRDRLSLPFFIYPNIDTSFHPFGSDDLLSSKDIMLENFNSIWTTKEGAGRSKELRS